MKILVTGMSASQCEANTPLKLHNVGSIYAEALRQAGHEVDHRTVKLGEDITGYDAMLLGMTPMMSISARRGFLVLDLILRARQSGTKFLFFIDDWRMREFKNNLRTIMKDPVRLYRDGVTRPGTRIAADWARDNVDYLMAAITALHENPWPPLIMGTFGFAIESAPHGPAAELLPTRHLICVDPTPLTRPYDHVTQAEPSERQRVWVNAALSDNEPWTAKQGFGWPVESFKRAMAKQKVSGELVIQRMPKEELMAHCAQRWGTIAAPYKQHLGSGYWRYRYVDAIHTGNISVGDLTEVGALEPYRYRPQQIETFTDDQLKMVADMQRDAFLAASWDTDRLVGAINDAMKEAV